MAAPVSFSRWFGPATVTAPTLLDLEDRLVYVLQPPERALRTGDSQQPGVGLQGRFDHILAFQDHGRTQAEDKVPHTYPTQHEHIGPASQGPRAGNGDPVVVTVIHGHRVRVQLPKGPDRAPGGTGIVK